MQRLRFGSSLSLGRLRSENIGTQIVPGDPGQTLDIEDPLRRHPLPGVQGRVLDPEMVGEGYRPPNFFRSDFDNLEHARK